MPKKLREEEIQNIIKLYKEGKTPKEIGELYQIYNNSVSRILRKNNIKPNQLRKLNNKEKEAICNYYNSGKSSEEIAKIFKVDPSTVCRNLKKQNITIRDNSSNKRKIHLNEKWLDQINEDQAYFLGLFLADGNVSKKGNGICLRLHSQDKEILEKLSYFFYDEVRVHSYTEDEGKKSTPVSRLCVYSKYLKNRLKEIGIGPNKVKNARIPKVIDQHLMSHFLRGLLDGDGCICIRKCGRATIDYTGNEYVINEIHSILEKKNIFGSIYYNYKKDSWSIQINRISDIILFLDWIYNDSSLYMKRKYDKYRKIKDKRIDRAGFFSYKNS